MSDMKPYNIHLGNCLDVLKGIPDNSVDSIVTDPPYGLAFMGKKWDYDVPEQAIWEECLRVLKPGGHLLAFAGTRTQHRMAVRIEDAGFEIRDMIAWVYGSGFPKSMDVSKAIDKAAGVRGHDSTRFNAVGQQGERKNTGDKFRSDHPEYVKPQAITESARQWQGWGTALKPALEPITVARKPFKGTVAANVLAHGTGALNIDGCRINPGELVPGGGNGKANHGGNFAGEYRGERPKVEPHTSGRWPANLIRDGSDEVLGLFPQSNSTANGGSSERNSQNSEAYWGEGGGGFKGGRSTVAHGDKGSAARFFYCAKTSRKDRNEGLDGFEGKTPSDKTGRKEGSVGLVGDRDNKGQTANPFANGGGISQNNHPTVKPTDLMAYLCRLVTPPGSVVLDPFMGSGSTGKAAMREGFRFIGIEMDESYLKIAEARIAHEAGK